MEGNDLKLKVKNDSFEIRNRNRVDTAIRCGFVIICEIFALYTFVMLMMKPELDYRTPLTLLTMLMILLPWMFERVFRCRIVTAMYLIMTFYSLGLLIGHCYNMFEVLHGWDKFLHILGGVVFAVIGFYIFEYLSDWSCDKRLIVAIFALCFSVMVSLLWEFLEFGSDMIFNTDSQNDTVITQLNSYWLNPNVGEVGRIKVEEVMVNGAKMNWGGYLDIGLIDTMLDLLLETFGALVTSVIFLISGKKLIIRKHDVGIKKEKQPTLGDK